MIIIESLPFGQVLERLLVHPLGILPTWAGRLLLVECFRRTHKRLYAAFEDFKNQEGAGFKAFADLICHSGGIPGDAEFRRVLDLLSKQWTRQADHLQRRAEADFPEYTISNVADAGGDRHAGGGLALRVDFAEGPSFAYKPRSCLMDAGFHAWLPLQDWLPRDCTPPAARVSIKEDKHGAYGWMEWVKNEPWGTGTPPENYFRKAGGLLFLMELFGAEDLHLENVIATASGPVLVDLECLLLPNVPPGLKGSQQRLIGPGRSGLLPGGQGAGNVSGFGGIGEHVLSTRRRVYVDINQDNMRWHEEQSRLPAFHNAGPVPLSDGTEWLVQGYLATSEAAQGTGRQACRDFIFSLSKARSRVLIRPSSAYGAILLQLEEGSPPSMDSWLGHLEPPLDKLRAAELAALANLDIPLSYVQANGTCLCLDAGKVENFFFRSGVDSALERLDALSQEAREAGVREIRACCAPPPPRALPTKARQDLHGFVLDVVREIALGVMARASWPEWTTTTADPAGISLYGGSLGTALFLASAAAPCGLPDAAKAASIMARKAASGHRPQPLGALVGIGSVIFGFGGLSALLNDPSLLEAAHLAADSVTEYTLLAETSVDWLGGLAGFVAAAAALGLVGPAKLGAEVLREKWVTATGLPGGLLHGAAGVALAFHRVSSHLPWAAAEACKALEREAAGFDATSGNWPSPGTKLSMNAVCNGAAGIAAVCQEIDPKLLTTEPWKTAWSKFLRMDEASKYDHLCCGNAGRLALACGLAAPPRGAISLVAYHLARKWWQERRYDLDAGAPGAHAGLFRGAAGIGWALLRCLPNFAGPDPVALILPPPHKY